MYKFVSKGLKKIKLDSDLHNIHKNKEIQSHFGMDNTSDLLDGNFGLYSTVNVKKNIGPFKTEYFRISLTRQGSAVFDIGLEKYKAYRNCILFGIPDQIFSLHDVSDDFLAYYMLYTEHFLSNAFLKVNTKQQFPFFTYSGVQCFELDEKTANEIEEIIFKINSEIQEKKLACSDAVRSYIQLILILANRNYGTLLLSRHGTSHTNQNLFNNYLKLIAQYFLTVRKVSDYAQMLNISPDHLNRVVKSYSDKTAGELIDEMLIIEAKTYLMHSELTVSEIAYKLDFSDPSHFTRFFKKLSKQTPLDFRKQS